MLIREREILLWSTMVTSQLNSYGRRSMTRRELLLDSNL
jgi:hypothetical protein